MRRLWLRVYLWFNGIVICGHPEAGTRYCRTCEEIETSKCAAKRQDHDEYLRRLQSEFRRNRV